MKVCSLRTARSARHSLFSTGLRSAVALVCGLGLGASGCASSQSAVSVAEVAESTEYEPPPPDRLEMIDECDAKRETCLPSNDWVAALCNDVYQEEALYMFRKSSPWKRLYLRKNVQAVNATGGAWLPGTVEHGEEVIALRYREVDSEFHLEAGGGGTYDVLRWNGSCATVDEDLLSDRSPTRMRHPRVEWRWLGDEMRTALREDEKINVAYRARRSECKAATIGSVTAECERLDGELIDKIVRHVRERDSLPRPQGPKVVEEDML